jgi:hypothetical protein
MSDSELERTQAEQAGAEAGRIGGGPGRDPAHSADDVDEAHRPLEEAGQGEAEGAEAADAELIENASHGDQHAARHVINDAPDADEDARAERHEDTRPADR